MSFVGLFLSGAVLFLNSLMLLGKADGKSVGVFNIFVGSIQIIIPFYLLIVSDQTNWELYNDAAIFLFGLTFLYFGITVLKGFEGNGLGWYSLWVSIIAVVYTITSIVQFHDVVNALTWGMWSFLWFLFFLSNALKKKIDHYLGFVAFVQSWVTLTIPSLLYFLGIWNTPPVAQIWTYVLILSIFSFVAASIFKLKIAFKKGDEAKEMPAV
ncbi:AmiS/UreI transporter [Neobacillus bataviensis LMG 21833]|uniref:AmiS/UreI transporter n=1 Tax=Neobacillus bataviensis LMG 21833 TaxID=1117379 RepID=K6D8W6_9BACI|nr:AmiS/UreI family transporter [Neobacillus bataviensis]EKN64769.1 AmiS/UreI transporter [Neobacillus bataviensis LMG 21833]